MVLEGGGVFLMSEEPLYRTCGSMRDISLGSAETLRAAVDRIQHTYDSQGQLMVLVSR